MHLYQPIKPFKLNQKFGENQICVDLATNSRVISCDGNNPPPGYKSLYGPVGHKGIDLMAYHGQPVYSASEGVVDSIDTNPKTGLDVRVIFKDGGVKHRVIYEHLLGYQPRVGDTVEIGSLIGWADNTGWSSGDHLHFQLDRWEDKWIPLDPLLYMKNVYALDAAPIYKKLKEKLAQLLDLLTDELRR